MNYFTCSGCSVSTVLRFTDGHHKLIRWRFVTHCAIDGYSRLVVYVNVQTIIKQVPCTNSLKAIREYGLPLRIRCDQGRKNIQVVRHMLHHRRVGRSALVRSSVHNQRIEQLWRDLYCCATQLFYRLFYYMEYNDLDPVNEKHICIALCVPHINKAIEDFRNAWNHHGV